MWSSPRVTVFHHVSACFTTLDIGMVVFPLDLSALKLHSMIKQPVFQPSSTEGCTRLPTCIATHAARLAQQESGGEPVDRGGFQLGNCERRSMSFGEAIWTWTSWTRNLTAWKGVSTRIECLVLCNLPGYLWVGHCDSHSFSASQTDERRRDTLWNHYWNLFCDTNALPAIDWCFGRSFGLQATVVELSWIVCRGRCPICFGRFSLASFHRACHLWYGCIIYSTVVCLDSSCFEGYWRGWSSASPIEYRSKFGDADWPLLQHHLVLIAGTGILQSAELCWVGHLHRESFWDNPMSSIRGSCSFSWRKQTEWHWEEWKKQSLFGINLENPCNLDLSILPGYHCLFTRNFGSIASDCSGQRVPDSTLGHVSIVWCYQLDCSGPFHWHSILWPPLEPQKYHVCGHWSYYCWRDMGLCQLVGWSILHWICFALVTSDRNTSCFDSDPCSGALHQPFSTKDAGQDARNLRRPIFLC